MQFCRGHYEKYFLRNNFEIGPVVKGMLFKDISIFSLVVILFCGA